jgi:hypothetical protein
MHSGNIEFFGLNSQLTNHFDPAYGSASTKSREACRDLIIKFKRSNHWLAINICILLEATKEFLTATRPEVQFKDDAEIKQIFIKMAAAINTFKSNQTTTSTEGAILADAVNYSVECVQTRLHELDTENPVRQLFDQSNNPLKLLTSMESSTSIRHEK